MIKVRYDRFNTHIGDPIPSAWFDFADPDLTITPSAADLTCFITATDPHGLNMTTSFDITFVQNTAPSIINPAGVSTIETYVAFSHAIDLEAIFSDINVNQTLSYTVDTNFSAFITHNIDINNELTISGTPEITDVGTTSVQINATDGYDTTTDVYNITVFHTNRPPTVNTSYILDDIDTYVDGNDVELNITGLFNDFEDSDANLTLSAEDQDGMLSLYKLMYDVVKGMLCQCGSNSPLQT